VNFFLEKFYLLQMKSAGGRVLEDLHLLTHREKAGGKGVKFTKESMREYETPLHH
jgi:hypothetical protein